MATKKHDDAGDRRSAAHNQIARSKNTKNDDDGDRDKKQQKRQQDKAKPEGVPRMLARVSGREAEHPHYADGGLRHTFVPATSGSE